MDAVALPLRKPTQPAHLVTRNAPATFATIAAGITVVVLAASTAGVPGWALGLIAVVIVAGGVGSMWFTRPDDD